MQERLDPALVCAGRAVVLRLVRALGGGTVMWSPVHNPGKGGTNNSTEKYDSDPNFCCTMPGKEVRTIVSQRNVTLTPIFAEARGCGALGDGAGRFSPVHNPAEGGANGSIVEKYDSDLFLIQQ
jgi:hypothetical protein